MTGRRLGIKILFCWEISMARTLYLEPLSMTTVRISNGKNDFGFS
jgi:hypothetical protein